MTTTRLRTCPLCEATCGLVLELEDDHIVRVTGDAQHPLSQGYLCPKGAAFGDLDADPDRLTRPRIRSGDDWREADWDEAFAFIDERLRHVDDTHGRESVALYLGNPNVHTLAGQLYARPFRQALRPGMFVTASTVDQMPKHRACGEMFGDPAAIPVPDIDRTDFLLVIGADPMMSNGSVWTVPDIPGRLRALRKRGGRLIVVDPRRSRTAARADLHLPIRPTTDAVLLAAMVTVLFEEDLVDLGDLEPHVNGVDDVRQALAWATPEVAATTCGIEADQVRTLARDLAAADNAVVYGRLGTTTTPYGTLASWLVDVLNVLTGNLDAPGGAMFPRPWHEDRSGRPPARFGRFHSRVGGHPEVLGEYPVAALADEITTPGPGQIRALFCVAGNPVLSTPDGPALDAALGDLDLMVAVDPYVTATSRRAHVILPPPPPRHSGHADLAFSGLAVRNVLQYTPPAVPLPADRLSEGQILLRLAAIAQGAGPSVDVEAVDDLVAAGLAGQLASRPTARTGDRDAQALLEAVTPRRGAERLIDLLLRSGPYGDAFGDNPDGWSLDRMSDHPHGVDLGPLEPRVPGVLTTASGRIELAPPAILADVPRLQALPDGLPDDALLLIGRRHLRTNNSWGQNVPALQGTRDLCVLHVHPDDALAAGVKGGQEVRLTSSTGQIVVPVEVTDDIRPGVVSLPHGFGHDLDGIELGVASSRPGANVNRLIGRTTLDPLSGTAGLSGVPVEVASA